MKVPLLSIIIPVYNVEMYLENCLNSIVQQDYKDFEIILINDGSTDSSGTICDKYAKNDSRIKVIHKKNEGVSIARNLGLKLAIGNYISFIDSDDTIEKDTYSLNMSILMSNPKIDILSFPMIFHWNGAIRRRYVNHHTFKGTETIFTKYFSGRLDDTMDIFIVQKIIKREIMKHVHFPENRICEDVFAIPQICSKAQLAICTPYGGYNYFQRPKSLLNSYAPQNKSRYILDSIDSTLDCLSFAKKIKILNDYKIHSYLYIILLYKDFLTIHKHKDSYIKKRLMKEMPTCKELFLHSSKSDKFLVFLLVFSKLIGLNHSMYIFDFFVRNNRT